MATRPDALDEAALVTSALPRVRYHARRYAALSPPFITFDDLMSEGFSGALDAARHFDPACGAAFPTYADYRIRARMREHIKREKRHHAVFDPLDDRGHAERTDVSPEDVVLRAQAASRVMFCVRAAVSKLPDVLRRVVRRRLCGETHEVIGKRSGMTRQGAHRREVLAREKLRKLVMSDEARADDSDLAWEM